ncbi:MAG: tandem-95 repeat protein [Betaproteobacteria bacterium]|nr:tandem-95 repeat protein [Betaproteobacteria bacterium]
MLSVTSTDADVPAGTPSYSIVAGADQGLFSINASSGALSFNTAPDFEAPADAGADKVYNPTVQVSDGLNTSTQAITVTVTNLNEAPAGTNYAVTTNEDTAHVFTTAEFGFIDPDAGDALSAVRIDTLPGVGSLTLSGVAVNAGDVISLADLTAGNLVFTPALNANGVGYASFTFSVRDTHGPAFDATPNSLSVDVTAMNDPPVASSESYSVTQGGVLTVSASGILGNDSDVDADPITAVLVASTSSGTLLLNANGSFSYTPNAGFAGTDSFTYRVNDGAVNSNITTVTLNVTAAPSGGSGGGLILPSDPPTDPGPGPTSEPPADPPSSAEEPSSPASDQLVTPAMMNYFLDTPRDRSESLEEVILQSLDVRPADRLAALRSSATMHLGVPERSTYFEAAAEEFRWQQVIRQGLYIGAVSSGTYDSELLLPEAKASQDPPLSLQALLNPTLWGGSSLVSAPPGGRAAPDCSWRV